MASASPKKETQVIAEFEKINLDKGVLGTLLVEGGHASVKITQHSQSPHQQILVKNYKNIPNYARDIWVADFNFDGYQDIALTSRIDKENNEQVYRLFTWKPTTKNLVPIFFLGPIYNLEHLPKEKLVRSSYLLNNHWTEDSYRFVHQGSYLYQRTRLVSPDIWHTEQYDIKGHVLRNGISSDGVLTKPTHFTIKRSVITTVAYLYISPNPTAHIAHTLTIGDQVTLVDFKQGANNFDWVNVESVVDDQVVNGWMLLSNLVAN